MSADASVLTYAPGIKLAPHILSQRHCGTSRLLHHTPCFENERRVFQKENLGGYDCPVSHCIGVCYALLILVGFRHQRQQRKAVPFNAKMMESHFSLDEGDTIIGVMDRKKTMHFYSGKDAMDEKSYE